MVAAVVVTVKGAVAATHAVTVAADLTALDQPAQEPCSPLGTARVPLRVVTADLPDALERVAIDDRRHRDRDPLLARALAVAGLAVARTAWPVAVERFAAVVVDGADVGLVAQQSLDRGGPPDRLAGPVRG